MTDLQVYVSSVGFLLDGRSLYDFAAADGAPFTYPPFAGLVFTPLALVPADALRLAWTVATLVLVVLLAALSTRADLARPIPSAITVPMVACLLFACAPVSSNIRFGQISLLLVVLVLIDCLGLLPHRYRGIATGVAAAVKLTPLVFVAYWWFSGQRRTAVNATAAFAVSTALAWIVLPDESARYWFNEIWDVNRVGDIKGGGNQSLSGALMRWELPDGARTIVAGAVGATIVLLGLVRAVRANRHGEPLAAAVIVGAGGLVFSPVSWTHHQVWLVLAGLLAVSAHRWVNLVWFVLVTALMVLPVTSVGAGLPGGAVAGNTRLFLAIAVACFVPFVAVRNSKPGGCVVAGDNADDRHQLRLKEAPLS
ncbi:glycosyltransferase 87 family protein [Micromonospora sp. HNM0581]|uniref:glycosyltransferase 87 family protein n=1 Tax=Micromonospora sp. HNM0581 TaxID=2716341 RepID=UPI001F0E8427|nr:glycosyltransferase 87 family protein [Micromonospora sp. HNM0581]